MVLGRVVVHDERDVIQVEPAGGDVGRNQRGVATLVEAIESFLASGLRQVTVHGDRFDPALNEALGESVRPALRANEHQRRAGLFVLQQIYQRAAFVPARDGDEAVLRLVHRLRLTRHLVYLSVSRIGLGQTSDLAVQRRGEEHRLAVVGDAVDDPIHLRLEAHVEHPIRFVQDQDLHGLQGQQTALDQVLETARSGDDYVGAGRQLRLLRDPHASVDRADPQVLGLGYLGELVLYLLRQFPGRDQHQGGRGRCVRVEGLDYRQRESKRLAGAGPGLGEDVASGESVLHDHGLDRERSIDAHPLEGLDDAFGYA